MSVGFSFRRRVSDGICGFLLRFVWLPRKGRKTMRNYRTIPPVWEGEMGGCRVLKSRKVIRMIYVILRFNRFLRFPLFSEWNQHIGNG